MNMTNVRISKIFAEEKINEFVPVSIDRDSFDIVRKTKPGVDFTVSKTPSGKFVRVFTLEGGEKLMSVYERDEAGNAKNRLFMKEDEAMGLLKEQNDIVEGLDI